MKKVLVYSILILFLFNSMGYYLLFEANRHFARKEMQSLISGQSLKLLVLTIQDVEKDKDFQRIHNKEFRYKGLMYDIVRELKSGRTTTFVCLHDKRESKLFAGLKKLTRNKTYCSMVDHLSAYFLPPSMIELPAVHVEKVQFPVINVSLVVAVLHAWSPPPEPSPSRFI